MENRVIVSDATPIIALEKIQGGFDFIRKMFDEILVPKQVLDEISFYDSNIRKYLIKNKIEDLLKEKNPKTIPLIHGIDKLDDGEKYAIALALENNLPILIHEKEGRKVAKNAGLNISGVVGQILTAYKEKIINKKESIQLLDELMKFDQINKIIYKNIISEIS